MNEHAYLDLDDVETLEPRKCDPGCRCGRCGSAELLELLWRNHEERRPSGERYPDMLLLRSISPLITPTVVDPFPPPLEPIVEPEPPPPPAPPMSRIMSKGPAAKPPIGGGPGKGRLVVDFSVEEPVRQAWEPTIASILDVTVQYYGVALLDVLSHRRSPKYVRPRQVGMYLAHKMTSQTYPGIARHFGDRDHTTVLHAARRVEAMMGYNEKLKADVEAVKGLVIQADPMLGGGGE